MNFGPETQKAALRTYESAAVTLSALKDMLIARITPEER